MPPSKSAPDNLMLIVGQLLEATKAASDGLKSMSVEVQGNAKAIIAASKTLEVIERKVGELEEIIKGGTDESLVFMAHGHTTDIAQLRVAIEELKKAVAGLTTDLGKLGSTAATIKGTKDVVWEVGKVVAWIVTTAIALYAAFNGK